MDFITFIQISGLILIFITFVIIVLWLMKPEVRDSIEDGKNIPFRDE